MVDDQRYEELKKADVQLKKWLDDAAANAHSELKEERTELDAIISDLSELFANTVGGEMYEEGKAYAQGDFVFNDNHMYVSLKDANIAPLTDGSSWVKTDLKTLMSNLDKKYATAIGAVTYDASATYTINEYVFDDAGNFYISLKDGNTGADLSDTTAWQKTDIETIIKAIDQKFTTALGSERYDATKTYSEGNFVFDDNGNLYVSLKDDNTSDLSDASAWKTTDVETALNDLNKTLQDVINSVIGAGSYVEGNTYQEGDYVMYEGDLYVSIVPNNAAPISDTSAWTKSDIKTIINELTKDTEKQLQDLRNDLTKLGIKQSSDLAEVKENLTEAINNNAELAKEENAALKESLLKKVNDFEDATEEGLSNLSDDIAKAMEDAGIADAALEAQIEALKNATAGDIKDLKDSTDSAIAALEDAATWSERVTYDNKAYVTHYNGSVQRLYHSLQNSNIGHEPGVSGSESWWEEVDTVTLINELQNQVTDNKNHLTDKNNQTSGEEFQYGVQGSQRGYYVNGSFKPF